MAARKAIGCASNASLIGHPNDAPGDGSKLRHVRVTGIEGRGKDDRVIDVVVHHLIAQFASVDPRLSIVNQSQAFRAIQVIDKGGDSLPVGCKPGGQQLVTDRILQAAETRNEGIDAFSQIVVVDETAGSRRSKAFREQAAIRDLKVAHLALDNARKVFQALGCASVGNHSRTPSRRATV